MPKSKYIKDELLDISQTVAELTDETPFNTPQPNYFEHFPKRILERIQDLEEDPSLDFLGNLDKEMPFKVPTGYFNQFKPVIPNENIKSGKVIPFRRVLRYAIAASLVGALTVWGFMSDNKNTTDSYLLVNMEAGIESISLDAYDSYLNEDAVSGIPDLPSEESDMQSTLLVEINKDVIEEILQEIPENDISLYLNQDGYDDTEIMD
jgi:hypothetical protein